MINIEQIKASINIVDVIDSHVKLKKNGQNYSACCPFHGEKSPSFTVSENKQFYHCFGCGAHGDVIKFVEEYFNLDFIDAVKHITGDNDLSNLSHQISSIKKPVRLPLDKKHHNIEEMERFIKSKCEEINGHYFYKSSQVIYTTDLSKNIVSMVMIAGKGFEPKHYGKEFLHGSCIVFGDIEKNQDVILCEDYFTSQSTFRELLKPTVCFFKPTNLRFLYQELKKITSSILVIAETQESTYQADSLNLLNCYMNNLQTKVEF